MVEHFGATAAGREMGLDRLSSLSDLQSSVPLREIDRHEREVIERLGFGALEGEVRHRDLAAGQREREHVVGVWRHYLGERPPQRVALLRGDQYDRPIDEIVLEDVRELGGELLRISQMTDSMSVLARLEAFAPDVLIVPSALTCRELEAVHRRPLEARLRRLRLIMAEHDLKRPVRTRIPIRSAGWVSQGGRIGLPSAREPSSALTLAVASQIIELLPYSNPEEDARRVYAKQAILPEQAVVSERYELVLSSPLGLLRLRTNEHVVVVGFDAPSERAPFPRPRVVRLAPAPKDVYLEGCTVAGAWLAASIRQALYREDPALVQAEAGPDPLSIPSGGQGTRSAAIRMAETFADTEFEWTVRTGAHRTSQRKPRGVLVRIELQGYVSPQLGPMLSQRIDESLRLRSPAYAHLRERDELVPPRIVVLEPGTREREQDARIRRLFGRVWMPEVRVVAGA